MAVGLNTRSLLHSLHLPIISLPKWSRTPQALPRIGQRRSREGRCIRIFWCQGASLRGVSVASHFSVLICPHCISGSNCPCRTLDTRLGCELCRDPPRCGMRSATLKRTSLRTSPYRRCHAPLPAMIVVSALARKPLKTSKKERTKRTTYTSITRPS